MSGASVDPSDPDINYNLHACPPNLFACVSVFYRFIVMSLQEPF